MPIIRLKNGVWNVRDFVRFEHLGRRPFCRQRRRPAAAIRAPLVNSRAGQKPPDAGPAHFRAVRRPLRTAGAGAWRSATIASHGVRSIVSGPGRRNSCRSSTSSGWRVKSIVGIFDPRLDRHAPARGIVRRNAAPRQSVNWANSLPWLYARGSRDQNTRLNFARPPCHQRGLYVSRWAADQKPVVLAYRLQNEHEA